MKYLILFLFSVFLSCTKTGEKSLVATKKVPAKLASKMEDTFPFSEAQKIEIISYPVRHTWDTVPSGEEGVIRVRGIVKNKALRIKQTGIKERIFLNEKLKYDLFKVLYKSNHPGCSVASCFEPRHAILFYNKKSEIIAFTEMCFGCGTDYASEGFKYKDLCHAGLRDVKNIFQRAGIKYYGEGQE